MGDVSRPNGDPLVMVDGVIEIPLPGRPLTGSTPTAPTRSNAEHAGDGSARPSAPPLVLPHFVAGPENRLVEVAVRWVADDRPSRFNPVVIYGPVGTGKSHLACGMAEHWSRSTVGRIECVTASMFAGEFAEAFEIHAVDEFRRRYRECDLLVFEDIQRLSGKHAAQEELVYTLDTLMDNDGRVVVTAADHPSRLAGLSGALQSRLVEGLTLPLAPPGGEVRSHVLRQLAALRQMPLTTAAVELLSKRIAGTVPQLDEAVVELQQSAQSNRNTVDVDLARDYLKRRAERRQLQIRDIAKETARYFSLRLADLRGPSRQRHVVIARAVAVYLARSIGGSNFGQIGRYFGGRDHSTVMYNYRKVRGLLKSDPAILRAVDTLQSKWLGKAS